MHNVIDSYSKALPTGLKILDGVVDTAMALKQQVPVDNDQLAVHCAEDIGACVHVLWGPISLWGANSHRCTPRIHTNNTEAFCPGLGPAETRDCLNQEFGSRVLSHECLKVILPRGALDLQIPNLSRFGESNVCACTYLRAHTLRRLLVPHPIPSHD